MRQGLGHQLSFIFLLLFKKGREPLVTFRVTELLVAYFFLGCFPRNLPLTFDRYNLSIAGVPVSLPFSQLTERPVFRRPLAEWELLFGYVPLKVSSNSLEPSPKVYYHVYGVVSIENYEVIRGHLNKYAWE